MFQPLRRYESSPIRINLLDIAKEFIKVYDKDRSEYSISYLIDFYSYFNEEYDLRSKPLFISKDGVVIDSNTKSEYYEDIGGEMNEESVSIDYEVFTCDKYSEIIKQRITNGLGSIGLEVVRISEIDGITYVSFDSRGGDIKKYKGYLRDKMDTAILPKNTVYDIGKIEECVLDTLEEISTARGKSDISIEVKDFPRNDLFYVKKSPLDFSSLVLREDCIDIFRIQTEADLLKLILFRLYLSGEIIDMNFNGSDSPTVEVVIREKTSNENDNKFELKYILSEKKLYINNVMIDLRKSRKINNILDLLVYKLKPEGPIDFDELEDYLDPHYLDGVCDDKKKMFKLNKSYVNGFEQLNRTIKINLSIKENIFITSSTSVQMNPSLSIKFLS